MNGANALYIDWVYEVNRIHPDFLLIRKIYLIYILISPVLKNNNYNIQLRATVNSMHTSLCAEMLHDELIHMTFIISLCVK